MKERHFVFIALAIGWLSPAWAADISSTTVQNAIADWPLIQAAGGIQVGAPVSLTAAPWKLPLTCDMSIHSHGTIIRKTLVQQEDKNIFISLILDHTVWTLTPERSQCKAVTIDSGPGTYAIYYRDAAGKSTPLGFAEFSLVGSGPGG